MNRSIFASASMLILVALTTTVSAQKERFAGTFVAADENTRGISRIALYDDDTINVWGKCHPTDCNWGAESVVAYAPGAGSDLQSSAKAMTAIYVHRHAVTVLVIKPMKDGSLGVDMFTRFTDRSGRTAYALKEIMVRENAAQTALTDSQ